MLDGECTMVERMVTQPESPTEISHLIPEPSISSANGQSFDLRVVFCFMENGSQDLQMLFVSQGVGDFYLFLHYFNPSKRLPADLDSHLCKSMLVYTKGRRFLHMRASLLIWGVCFV